MKTLFFKKNKRRKKLEKEIVYKVVKELILDHVISLLECNNELAVETLGRSPKHMFLFHDADPKYEIRPKSTYSKFGFISQIAFGKIGENKKYYDYSEAVRKLNKILV